jgi:exodeoxyribonuclease VII large subunit
VQGPEAPLQIVQAIQVFNRLAQVDVIIVGRGGGSIEELWAFNDERVVRAIAASVIPVVSAVGHQTDYTLADFVADRRAATPSQAAEIVVPDIRELQRYVVSMRNILETNIRNNVKNLRLQLEQCRDSRVFAYPLDLLNDKRQLLDGYVQHIEQAIRQILLTKQHQFKITAEKMAMLNPLAVLARGYSIVRTSDSKVVKQASDVAPGQELEVILHKGMIQVTVVQSKGGD